MEDESIAVHAMPLTVETVGVEFGEQKLD